MNKSHRPIFYVLITLLVVIVVAAAAVFAFWFFKHSEEKQAAQPPTPTNEPLIKVTEQIKVEHGLIGEGELLGKRIDHVLEDYKEGEDYIIEKCEDGYSYIFLNVDYGYGTSETLALYKKGDSTKVYAVYYEIYIEGGGYLHYSKLKNLKSDLTEIYGVSPLYCWKDGTSSYYDSKDDSNIDIIAWKSKNITASLRFPEYETEGTKKIQILFLKNE